MGKGQRQAWTTCCGRGSSRTRHRRRLSVRVFFEVFDGPVEAVEPALAALELPRVAQAGHHLYRYRDLDGVVVHLPDDFQRPQLRLVVATKVSLVGAEDSEEQVDLVLPV